MLYNKTKYSTSFLNPTILLFFIVYTLLHADPLFIISINNHVITLLK